MKIIFFLGILIYSPFLYSQASQNSTQSDDIPCDSWLYLPDRGSFFEFGELDVPGNIITVEAMVNRTIPYTGGNLYAGDVVSKHREPTNVNYLLRPNSAEITANNRYHIAQAPCEIELNITYHIAMVYDGSTLKFYRNGHLMQTVSAQGNLYQNSYKSRVGIYEANIHNEQFIGYVNEVRVWNVAKTQQEIRDFMNKRLPDPENQTGLLAYFNFSSLKNLQGNSQYDGRISGNASIRKTNPACMTFNANSCFEEPDGILKGSIACSDQIPTLSFSRIAGKSPFTITYTDGVKTFTQTNVYDNIPFPVQEMPVNIQTTYKLLSVSDASGKPLRDSETNSEAEIKLEICSSCESKRIENLPFYDFGRGSTTPTMAEYNENLATDYGLLTGSTSFTTGNYKITDKIPTGINYHAGIGDFSGNGRMAIFQLKNLPSEIMRTELELNCENYEYSFAFSIANAIKNVALTSPPKISVYIESSEGKIIGFKNIGEIPVNADQMVWQTYEVAIPKDYNSSKIIVRIINDNPSFGNQNNLIAIDEIEFRACIPEISASFHNSNLIDSIMVCPETSFNLFAFQANNSNQSLNWQYSINGDTWVDLNLNGNQIEHSLQASDTKYKHFRYLINTNNSECNIFSNHIVAEISPKADIEFKNDTICIGNDGNILYTINSGTIPFNLKYNIGSQVFNYSLQNLNGTITIDKQFLNNSATLNQFRITDNFNCGFDVDNEVLIQVNEIPQGGISGEEICENDSIFVQFNSPQNSLFNISISYGSEIWNFENVSNGQKIYMPVTTFQQQHEFQLEEIYDVGLSSCSRNNDFLQKNVIINTKAAPHLEFSNIDPVCSNESPFFINTARETSNIEGTWSFSGPVRMRPDGYVDPALLGAGEYEVFFNFKALNGCSDSASSLLKIKSLPSINAGFDRIVCQDTIHLNATGATHFEWINPINLSDSRIANPVASINGNVSYVVKGINDDNCFAYDTVTILMPSSSINSFNIPNAFTPNNDGKNDCFGINHWPGIEVKEFTIYNRYGQKVFSTRNPSECWDGRLNGVKQENGGYVYVINALTPCGIINRKGIVMLIN